MKKGRLTRDMKLRAKELLGEKDYNDEVRKMDRNIFLDKEIENND
jgi:hypothetical protein